MSRNTSRRRRIAFAASALSIASAVALAGCSGADPNAKGAASQIVVAYTNETPTLDPARSDYVQTNAVALTLYDALVAFDKDGTLQGSLAEKFAYNDAVDAVDITLRKGVTFHDGSPLTAEDVKWTLDHYKELGVGIIGMIRSYASTDVHGDTELTIHLQQADPQFLGALSRIYIVNSKLAQQHLGSDMGQSWFLTHDAGSGPYSLVSNDNGTFTLARYDEFWQFDKTRPEKMVLRRIDDYNTTEQELLAGNIDLGQIPLGDRSKVEKAGFNTATWATPTAYVYFNTAVGATSNKAVREAITYAYNYKEGLEKFRAGQGELADGPLMSMLPCRPDLPTVQYSPDKAKQALAASGISDLSLTMRYQSKFAEQTQEATLLQSNLAEIGVDMKLEPIAFADYLTALQDPKTIPEVFLATDAPPYPDPGVVLTQVYYSGSVGTNRGGYSNPAFDALIDKARTTPDADARCAIYQDAQKILADDYAVMPLYTAPLYLGASKKVVDYDAKGANYNPSFREYRLK